MPRKASENKVTSKPVARKASKVLRKPGSRSSKAIAGSALSQARGRKGK